MLKRAQPKRAFLTHVLNTETDTKLIERPDRFWCVNFIFLLYLLDLTLWLCTCTPAIFLSLVGGDVFFFYFNLFVGGSNQNFEMHSILLVYLVVFVFIYGCKGKKFLPSELKLSVKLSVALHGELAPHHHTHTHFKPWKTNHSVLSCLKDPLQRCLSCQLKMRWSCSRCSSSF